MYFAGHLHHQASSVAHTLQGVCIIKPIVFGNVARYFGKKREEDGHTHHWTVYLKPYRNEVDISYQCLIIPCHVASQNSKLLLLTVYVWGFRRSVIAVFLMLFSSYSKLGVILSRASLCCRIFQSLWRRCTLSCMTAMQIQTEVRQILDCVVRPSALCTVYCTTGYSGDISLWHFGGLVNTLEILLNVCRKKCSLWHSCMVITATAFSRSSNSPNCQMLILPIRFTATGSSSSKQRPYNRKTDHSHKCLWRECNTCDGGAPSSLRTRTISWLMQGLYKRLRTASALLKACGVYIQNK